MVCPPHRGWPGTVCPCYAWSVPVTFVNKRVLFWYPSVLEMCGTIEVGTGRGSTAVQPPKASYTPCYGGTRVAPGWGQRAEPQRAGRPCPGWRPVVPLHSRGSSPGTVGAGSSGGAAGCRRDTPCPQSKVWGRRGGREALPSPGSRAGARPPGEAAPSRTPPRSSGQGQRGRSRRRSAGQVLERARPGAVSAGPSRPVPLCLRVTAGGRAVRNSRRPQGAAPPGSLSPSPNTPARCPLPAPGPAGAPARAAPP